MGVQLILRISQEKREWRPFWMMFVLMHDPSDFAQSHACMHIFQTTLPIHAWHESRTSIGDLQEKDRLRQGNRGEEYNRWRSVYMAE